MESKTVYIPKISCGHCVMTIKREVGELDGITSIEGDEKTKMITFTWEIPATWEKIAHTLNEIGYPTG